MKKTIITAILTAGKGKVIRQISTNITLGKEITIHPQVTPMSDYDEVAIDASDGVVSRINSIDLSDQTGIESEYAQALVDNMVKGDTIVFSSEDADRLSGILILGENKQWEDNSIIAN